MPTAIRIPTIIRIRSVLDCMGVDSEVLVTGSDLEALATGAGLADLVTGADIEALEACAGASDARQAATHTRTAVEDATGD